MMSFPQQVDDPSLISDANNMITGKDSNYNQVTVIRSEERGCGISTKSLKKIVGGTAADSNEWPWMVALIRRSLSTIFCGGVLITDRHVLSAAHCTYKYNKYEILVRLGEYNFEKKNETRARDMSVIEIYQHEDFDENTYDNDIALLKLLEPILFNSYIWPVCMPPSVGETSFEGFNGNAWILGWGSMFFGGPSSDVLMEVSVPIWTTKACQNVFIERIGENVLCAGAKEGGRDSCQVRKNEFITSKLLLLMTFHHSTQGDSGGKNFLLSHTTIETNFGRNAIEFDLVAKIMQQ